MRWLLAYQRGELWYQKIKDAGRRVREWHGGEGAAWRFDGLAKGTTLPFYRDPDPAL